jgi:hypothetical protein
MLLDYSPQVTYLGEVRNFHEYLTQNKPDFNGELIAESPFWHEITSYLPRDPVDLETKIIDERAATSPCMMMSKIINSPVVYKLLSHFCPTLRRQRLAYANIRQYYSATEKAVGTRWVLDSSHRTAEVRDHFHVYGSRVKVIFLVRDGRGVVNSVMRRTGVSVEVASKQWKRFILGARRFHQILAPNQILEIRYEDLCEDLENQLLRLTDFLGIDMFADTVNGPGVEHHFIGGSSTLRNSNKGPFKIKLDEKWKRTLSNDDLDTFSRIAGDTNWLYGYEG